jgi:hypothetical protein
MASKQIHDAREISGRSMKKIPNMSYHCGIIVEGVHYRRDYTFRQLGIVNVGHVERQLGEMLRDIQASPRWNEDGDLAQRLRFLFDPIKYALTFLASYLESESPTEEERMTAIIFASYVYIEVPKLVKDFGCEETAA